jgi:hypothetical protein
VERLEDYVLLATSVVPAGNPLATAVQPAAAATHLELFPSPPYSTPANLPFSFTVFAKDNSGNVDFTYNSIVSVQKVSGPAGGALGGTTHMPSTFGTAGFSDLTFNTAGDYVLQVSSGSLPTLSDIQVTVTPPITATHLVLTPSPPGSVPANSPFGFGVSAENDSGTVDFTYDSTVTVAVQSGPPGGVLGGTTTIPISSGGAGFTGLTFATTGHYLLQVSSGSLPTLSDIPVTVTAPTTATRLVVTIPPDFATAGGNFGFEISAEDNQGFIATNYNNTLTLTLASGPTGATLGGTTTVQIVNGVASFGGLLLTKAGTYTIQGTSDGLTPVTTDAFTVLASSATHLVVTTQPPTSIPSGNPFGMVVAAEDNFGNVDTNYPSNELVSLARVGGPAGATLGGNTNVAPVDGVATFTDLTLDKVGNYQIRADSDDLLGATTTAINATTPTQATKLVVTTEPPSSVGAGNTFTLVVSAEDASGNVAGSYNTPIIVTITSGTGPAGGTLGGTTTATIANGLLVNGVATFSNLTLSPASTTTYTLTATSDDLSPATTTPIMVVQQAVVATKLVITTEPPSTVTPGDTFTVVVKAENSAGTVDASYTGPISVAITSGTGPGGGTLGGTTTATIVNGLLVNGVATFSNLTLDKAGSAPYRLTTTSDGLAPDTTTPITVTSAHANHLVVTAEPPDSIAAGSPFGLVVVAEDRFGNIDTNYNSPIADVTIANGPAGGSLGGTTSVLPVNGVMRFTNLTLNSPGSYTLRVTSDDLIPATTRAISASGGIEPEPEPEPEPGPVDHPTVTNLQRFGFHAQPTLLVLTFSTALDPARASNTANYAVVGPAHRFPIASAVYNPTNHTVTLRPQNLLNVHRRYTITVNGTPANGLTSSRGIPLDGANTGKPGSSYVKTFGKEILAGPASSAGVGIATALSRRFIPRTCVLPAHVVPVHPASWSARIESRPQRGH